jgi:hypothetical protein
MTDKQILQTINAVSKRVNEMGLRLDRMAHILYDKNASNIDYLSLMTDNELPIEDSLMTEQASEEEVTEDEA